MVTSLDVVVVGGGMGGLAAAIALGASGRRVRLCEAGPVVGGKVGSVVVDGVECDTGPSVLTLPDVVDAVLRRAGMSVAESLALVRPSPAFRYHFPSGRQLDVFVDVDETLASVRDALGPASADEMRRFLAYAGRIWEASKDHFVFAAAPTVSRLVQLAFSRPRDLIDVDPLRSMAASIEARVRSPELRLLLLRYATYNGSNPYTAPATLNCIAHVELALGGFGVAGGMMELLRVLARAADKVGVEVVTGARVDRVVIDGGVVRGVDVGGAFVACSSVVVNADVGWLRSTKPAPSLRLPPPSTPSMSGATAIVRAKRNRKVARVAHEVVFADDYAAEAAEIFGGHRPPTTPTVYLCSQERAHERRGWADDEPVFVMVNTPPIGRADGREDNSDDDIDDNIDDNSDNDCLQRGLVRAQAAGLLAPGDTVVWQRGARELAAQFPGSQGSLYGAASNDRRAAFQRPGNVVDGVRGLYLASGSAHPGGGVPLCLQSGLLAADAILASTGTGAAGQTDERDVQRRIV